MFAKKNIGVIALCAIVAFGFLFTYSAAYHDTKYDYTREIVLALMASSVTMIITSMLLRQQTRSEELKDTHTEIFRKKFDVYTDFLRVLIISFEDNANRRENVQRLEEGFYNLILFIDKQETFSVIYDAVMDSLRNDDRKNIGKVLFALRRELGIHDLDSGGDKMLLNEGFWTGVGEKMNGFFDLAEHK